MKNKFLHFDLFMKLKVYRQWKGMFVIMTEIKRKGNEIVCKENYFNIKDDKLLYFTFDSLEKTGIVKHCFYCGKLRFSQW